MATALNIIPPACRADVERAVRIVHEEQCGDIFVFGSVATNRAGHRSDLDLAVRGCPPERFYRLLGRLMEELTHPVDLIDLDTEREVAQYLEEEEQLIHVG